ncbi:hypothetical protein TPA0908_40360 [Micromonospora sp. AKA38]|nr:hypothetical protein TPA0908_40360 [Micromonospora sp. AKA38]
MPACSGLDSKLLLLSIGAGTGTMLWRLLPDRFVGVELSPVAPLGTCSALGPVDQHRVFTMPAWRSGCGPRAGGQSVDLGDGG